MYPPGWKNSKGEIAQGKTPIQETWQAMERLVDIGLVRSIGMTNFQASLIIDLLRYARIRPAIVQAEINPYLVQDDLVEFCHSENFAITAYSSYETLTTYLYQLNIYTQIWAIIIY
jgi:D-xylose reductase